MMHLSLQVPHAGFLEFTFGVFVFLFFTLLCQEVTSSFFMFLRKCDQMTKISICFYLGRISLRYLIPVYVRFFFFLVISHIPTISQDLHWQWVFLLAGKFHIIQKGKLLVKKLETEADFGMYQEAVVDSLFLVLM